MLLLNGPTRQWVPFCPTHLRAPTTFSPVSLSLPRAPTIHPAPLPLPLPTQLHCPAKISVATASAPIKQRRLRRPELRGIGSGANRFSPLLFSIVELLAIA